jgi:hypothetical protein
MTEKSRPSLRELVDRLRKKGKWPRLPAATRNPERAAKWAAADAARLAEQGRKAEQWRERQDKKRKKAAERQAEISRRHAEAEVARRAEAARIAACPFTFTMDDSPAQSPPAALPANPTPAVRRRVRKPKTAKSNAGQKKARAILKPEAKVLLRKAILRQAPFLSRGEPLPRGEWQEVCRDVVVLYDKDGKPSNSQIRRWFEKLKTKIDKPNR